MCCLPEACLNLCSPSQMWPQGTGCCACRVRTGSLLSTGDLSQECTRLRSDNLALHTTLATMHFKVRRPGACQAGSRQAGQLSVSDVAENTRCCAAAPSCSIDFEQMAPGVRCCVNSHWLLDRRTQCITVGHPAHSRQAGCRLHSAAARLSCATRPQHHPRCWPCSACLTHLCMMHPADPQHCCPAGHSCAGGEPLAGQADCSPAAAQALLHPAAARTGRFPWQQKRHRGRHHAQLQRADPA